MAPGRRLPHLANYFERRGLADLCKQKLCRVRSLTFKGCNTTDSKRSNGFKQLSQLPGASLIKSIISAVCDFGDLLEAHSRDLIIALLEHENRNTETGKQLSRSNKLILTFLATVSDVDQSVDLALVCFA